MSASLATWVGAIRAAGSDLRAYLEATSGANMPRDIVHIRAQELIFRTGASGGWQATAEAVLDADARRSRAVDVLLRSPGELALFEVWDWFDDLGAALRSFDRRLAAARSRSIASMRFDEARTPRVS